MRDKPLPPRLPKRWKRREDGVFCPDCWRKRYVLRAITVPVASPLDCGWKELDANLKAMWSATTAASNWMMTEFYRRDVRRNGQRQLPPMPRVYLYPEARQRFTQLPSQTVAALERAVGAKYRAKRYDVIWTCSASLPTFRYPTPFPVPNQGWTIGMENDAPVVSLRIADARIRLRLKGGPQFRRQRRAFEDMIAGEAVRGECALYRQGTHIMVKLAAWLPRKEGADRREGTVLRVSTQADALLQAVNTQDQCIWRYNGDHLRRWTAEHARQLQRWSEDSKVETRPVPSFAPRRQAAVAKYRRRMETACHEIAAQLAGYATRRHFAKVVYDDNQKGFCSQFPYFRLRQLLTQKLDVAGIQFEAASGLVEDKPTNRLAVG
jgi:hypothetical protein